MIQDFEEALKLGENLFFERKFGRIRVKKELEKKEINANIIEKVMEKLDPGFEERHIKYIILNKYGRRIFIDQEREKIVRLMVRYGYDADKAVYVLDCLERAEL